MHLSECNIIPGVVLGAMTLWGMAFGHPPTGQIAKNTLAGSAISSSVAFATSTFAHTLPALPARIFIPTLEINANIQHVGFTATGAMAAPKGFKDAGWYKYGMIPGQRGGAVIGGHVDNGLALPGIFKNLDKIERGADIYISTASSTILHFVVTNLASYDYKNTPNQEVFADTQPGSRIRLITCVGDWIKSEKTYDERLVVTAELVAD